MSELANESVSQGLREAPTERQRGSAGREPSRRLINPPTIHPAHGYSHISLSTHPRTAYVAGQVALDRDFGLVGGADLGEQTRAAMRNVGAALREIGAGWDDVIRRTVYTLRPHDHEIIAAAIQDIQGSDRHPAQTIVGVTGLAVEGLLIEIEVVVGLADPAPSGH